MTPGTPTPTIHIVTDTGNGQAPVLVTVNALDAMPHDCYWNRPIPASGLPASGLSDAQILASLVKYSTTAPGTGWSDVQADPDALTFEDLPKAGGGFEKTPDAIHYAFAGQVLACLRQRDAAYNATQSQLYLGGGDVGKTDFSWDFGDTGSEYDHVKGFGAQHVYYYPANTTGPVTRTITLTVTNNLGLAAKVTKTVTIQPDARKVVTIATQAELDAVLQSSLAGKKVVLQSGASFTVGGGANNVPTQFFALDNDTWVTTSGAAPATIVTNYMAANASVFETVNGTNHSQHVVVENLQFQIVPTSQAPHIAVLNGGTNVALRALTYSASAQSALPTQAFMLEGNAELLQECGGVPSASSPAQLNQPWPNGGSTGEWAWIQGSNVSLYGNFAYRLDNDGAAGEAGFRACNPTSENISFVNNKVGGYWGKDDTITLRSGHNIYLGGNFVRGGVFDMDAQCGGSTVSAVGDTSNVVVDSNQFENAQLQLNPGVYAVSLRNNFHHQSSTCGANDPTMNPLGAAYNNQLSIGVGGDGTLQDTTPVNIAGNSFIFECDGEYWNTVGMGIVANSRIEIVDNLFYLPAGTQTEPLFVGAALPANITRLEGNAFLLAGATPATQLIGRDYGTNAYDFTKFEQFLGGHDSLFAASAAGLPTSTGEDLSAYRQLQSSPVAASATNLALEVNGVTDTFGLITDLADPFVTGSTAIARPATGGWTPGALQAQ